METLEGLLIKKKKVITILYKLAIRFKNTIMSNNAKSLVSYIERREKMQNELNLINSAIEKIFLITKKDVGNIGKIIEINLLLNELIKIEKENEILLNQTLELITGSYINNYKKFKK